jgi:hypothetical protein
MEEALGTLLDCRSLETSERNSGGERDSISTILVNLDEIYT